MLERYRHFNIPVHNNYVTTPLSIYRIWRDGKRQGDNNAIIAISAPIYIMDLIVVYSNNRPQRWKIAACWSICI